MAPGREDNEQQATNHPHRHRQRRQNLLGLLRRRRIQTCNHILIKHRHRREYHDRHHRMKQIHQSQPIFRGLLRRERGGAVDNPEATKGGNPVPHLSPLVSKTIGETQHEARGGAAGEEGGGGGDANEGFAFPFMRDDRR